MMTRLNLSAVVVIFLGVVSVADVRAAPAERALRLAASTGRAGGMVDVVLRGRNLQEFTAAAGDVWLDTSALSTHQCRTSSRLAKLPFCSERQPGVVRFALIGLNEGRLTDGDLLRLQVAVAEDVAPGTYPISTVVSLSRPDGTVLEIGPIGAKVRVRAGRERDARLSRESSAQYRLDVD